MQAQDRQKQIQKKSVFISCIVPVFNEQGTIEAFLDALQQCLASLSDRFEIIVVDDGSKDKTLAKALSFAENRSVKVIGLSRNFGKEIALTAGLEHCKGDVAIMMDADFQHPIETLPHFLQKWGDGFEMVYGLRRDRKNESWLKRNFAKIFYWIMTKCTRMDMPAHAGDFRLLDRKVINAMNSFQERTRFMKGLYAWVGFKKTAVVFEVQARRAGESSWRFMKLVELAITAITSFSDIPLRIWGLIGFVISMIALVYALFFVTYTLLYGVDFPGFPSIIVSVMFLGGIQLLSIGILGEYIGRIFTEVKQRPKYIIETKKNFD
ncbi:glycosyl transferase family 2 [Gammaproteobacteria bacterium SCGC AG-212-F23]|nr:glycosyl transferase family 2 [Gammaproteobacteria bacterium SCGC AG-212-F23]